MSAAGQPSRRHPWAHVIPATGGTPRRLPLGPLADLAQRAEGPAVLLSATMTREMAWQKRYRGGTAGKLWWNRRQGTFVRARRRPRRQPRRADVVGDRIAFLSDHEGWGNLYSLARRRRRPAPPHRPRGRRRARVLRPARRHRRHPGRLRVGRASSGCSTTSTGEPRRLDIRLGGPRTAREPLPRRRRRVAGPRAPGPHRPGQRRRASAAPCTGSPTATGPPARCRRPPACGPGSPRRWARTARCGSTTRDGEDAVCVAPLDPRAPDAPRRLSGRRVRPRAGARPRARRQRASPSPPTTAGCCWSMADWRVSASWPAAATARSTAWRSRPDSAWLAYCDPVGSGLCARSSLVRLADGDGRSPVTERRFRDADPVFTLDGKHLAFLSLRSFDPIYDEHAFDLTFPGVLAAVPGAARRRARRRRSGRARTGARSRPRTTSRRTRRARRVRPRRRDRAKRPARRRRRRTTARPRSSSTSRGSPPGWCRCRSSRRRYRGMRAAKDCLLLVPPPGQRRARRRPRGHRREAREAGAGALRPGCAASST